MKQSKHFKIQELVCKHVFNRDGHSSWRYLRPVVIDFIDWFRDEINNPVYVNNWYWGGPRTQRGVRCNMCQIVKDKTTLYTSAHIFGCAIDFNVKGYTPNQVREWLDANIYIFFLQFPQYTAKVRLESSKYATTWVHVDFFDHNGAGIVQYIKPAPNEPATH